jgi:two-component system, sensor histidine kinase and response regulator
MEQHAAELEELNRELADASRFKTEFVSTMSHELRTPLTAIIGASELLARSDLNERDRNCVQTINEAAEALFALINSILDFSKIEAGKLDLQLGAFEIETVVESAAEVVAQLARDNQITLHAYVDPLIPPVSGDADRIRQVLLNLLGNAVKFTERGRIVVRALPLELNAADVTVRFEVQDTGIGIPPEVVGQLFEPFAQADRSASRKFAGTGLGLSISKRLVNLMNGEIGVQSEPGAGSLFWFTARFGRAPALSAPKRTIEGVGALVLSSDETFVQIVQHYMTSWKMESRVAANRDDVVGALQAAGTTWVAVVDLDDVGVADLGMTVDILRAIVPARVLGVGKDGPLRKPLRQSYLFDAIVKAVGVSHVQAISKKAVPASNSTDHYASVLVAEDNRQLQRLLKLQFDSLGVPVTFVSDGREAVGAIRDGSYTMMFMDCQMPNMDGFTATKTIRDGERTSGQHLPIVAMTANAFAEDRAACLAAGMDDYLAKPVKLRDLQGMIERWSQRDVQS